MCCSRPALFLWLACALVCQSYKFVELQEIFTNGAVKWEPFSMAGIQYIAVCNHFADSKIYKWDDAQSTFLEMQSIPTQGALGSTAFSMDGIQHLAIANSFDGSSYNIDSKVYKWDDTRSTFLEMQSIPTQGAWGWAAFSMDSIQHLAVANHFDGSSCNINSTIYKWDHATSTFLEMQSIPTSFARGWAAFSMDGIQHLAVANRYDGSSYNINSKVYKWDNASSTFLEMQSIPTKGAVGWTAFSMDGIQHLAVANERDSAGSHNVDSMIYKWDDTRSTFLEMQSISTKGTPAGWAAFSMDGIQHLAVGNYFDGSSNNLDSKVYRWDDTRSTFLEMQSIRTVGAWGWAAFSMDGIQHLALANRQDGAGSAAVYSKLYIWATSTTTTSTISSATTITTATATVTTSTTVSSSITATSTTTGTSTTTRTEAPSLLAATDFAFEDVRSWSLAALGGYLVALSVPVFMAKMCKQAGSRSRQSSEAPQSFGISIEDGPSNSDRPRGSAATASSATPAVAGARGGQSQTTLLTQIQAPSKWYPESLSGARQIMKKSPYILAIKMLLESGNLLSTMLYAMEAHQRAILVGYSAPCGAGTLMPLKRSQCPSTSEAIELPACHAFLVADKVCEADAEVDDGSCFVSKELDNCGDFDAYRMEQLACGAIGCKALSHILWVAALISFGATVGWNAGFYALRLRLQVHQPSRLQNRFVAFFAFLAVLLVTTIFVGFAGDSGAVLAMALLCPLLPVTAWALAAGFVFLPLQGQEAIESTGAALELPIFNVLVAFNLSVDDVERLNRDRTPLNMGLRVVEDIPELVIGLVDLVYFGGSWYAWFGILMSMAMLVFDLLLSVMLQCLQSALKIARKPRDRE